MFLVPVNYLAVLVSGIVSMVLGFVWYGPLFGKPWAKMVGLTKEKMEKAKPDMPKNYGIMFLASLVMAWVLVHFIWYAAPGSATMVIGLKTAFWAWLGFVGATGISKFLFMPDRKPWSLFMIDTGYYLVNLLIMAVVIVSIGY